MPYQYLPFVFILFLSTTLIGQQYSARTAHLYVQSANKFVEIEADNYQMNSTIDATNGKINLLGLLKSFEFRIGGLDQAFNSKLIKTISHPKFKYIGEITNIKMVQFNVPGKYPIDIKGTLYVWDLKRITPGTGVIEVHKDGTITAHSDISFQIEDASVEKTNKLIKSYMPPTLLLDMDKLGISKSVKVKVNGTYRKKRSSSNASSK